MDVFLGSLDVVRIEIDEVLVFPADEVKSLFWFSSQETFEPLPSHHDVQYLQVVWLRVVQA